MANRQQRGRRTEMVVANHLRRLFPHARPAPAYTPGADLEDVPGLAIEVKARRGLALKQWMAQARAQAGGRALPLLVVRLDGQGEQTVGQWPAITTLDDMLALLRDAGYGTPDLEHEHDT